MTALGAGAVASASVISKLQDENNKTRHSLVKDFKNGSPMVIKNSALGSKEPQVATLIIVTLSHYGLAHSIDIKNKDYPKLAHFNLSSQTPERLSDNYRSTVIFFLAFMLATFVLFCLGRFYLHLSKYSSKNKKIFSTV